MQLMKTLSKFWAEWIGGALGTLALLFSAEAVSGAPCDVKTNASPVIRRNLNESYCELRNYGYITPVISNPYERMDMNNTTVVENLGSSGLSFEPNAPMHVIYHVNDGPFRFCFAPAIIGCGSTLTFTLRQIPDLNLLGTRQGSNESNTINVFASNKVVFPGGSPCLVASNNIVDFIFTGDFVACTRNCPLLELL